MVKNSKLYVKKVYKKYKQYKPTKPKQTVKKEIKRQIRKEFSNKIETKRSYVEPSSCSLNASLSNIYPVLPNITTTNFYQLMPEITQGTTEQNRIGTEITPKGLYVKGCISTDWLDIVANNSSFQNIYVRVLCLSDKQNPVDSLAYAAFTTSYNTLLEKGSSSTNFQFSDPMSIQRPVNRNRFNVYYDKTFHLGAYSANIGTSNIDQYHGSKKFSFKVPMKKKFKYNDNDSRPNNISMPFLLVGYCPADQRNTTAGATTTFLNLSYYTDFYYTDA